MYFRKKYKYKASFYFRESYFEAILDATYTSFYSFFNTYKIVTFGRRNTNLKKLSAELLLIIINLFFKIIIAELLLIIITLFSKIIFF